MEQNIIKTEVTREGDLRETIEIVTTKEQIQEAVNERTNIQAQIDDLISKRDVAIAQAAANITATFTPVIQDCQSRLDDLNALVKKGEDNSVIAVSVEKGIAKNEVVDAKIASNDTPIV